MNYESMTGEQNFNDMGWDSTTGQQDTGMFFYEPVRQVSVGEPKKSKKPLIVVAVILAVALLTCAGVFAGVYFEKGNVVLRAVADTIKDDSHLAENGTIMSDIVSSGKYTIDIKGEEEGQEFRVKIMDAITQKQVKGTVDVEELEVDFNLYLDEERLALYIPVMSERVFVYNYMAGEKNNGYLMQYIDPEAVTAFNDALIAYTNPKEQGSVSEDILGVFLEEYKKLEFVNAEEKAFEVDGSSRECKGYETTITAANIVNLLNAYEELFGVQKADELTDGVDFGEYYTQMRDAVSEMPDVKTTFYLYDNKLAAITLNTSEQSAEIAFLGGDTRTQNMTVSVEDQIVMEVKGTTQETVEDTKIYVMDQEIYSLQYDYEAGNYTLNIPSQLYAEGSLTSEKNQVVLAIDKLEMEGEAMDASLECSVTKGAAPVKISGDSFDIGTASAADFSRLGKDISKFYQKVYRDVYLK